MQRLHSRFGHGRLGHVLPRFGYMPLNTRTRVASISIIVNNRKSIVLATVQRRKSRGTNVTWQCILRSLPMMDCHY